ncbi:DUF1801 domain-containing protein [Saccharospirillum impatiens]|uniref:DUF1801 domain-containing protein n=1 Tax=Saccharospirillum impatiens TaxID=169438 RepID=UPI00042594AC|nr:DUF1801 domain-containing protein [Saccharospirillum impatiens]
MNPAVQTKFESYPTEVRRQLTGVRDLIHAQAAAFELGKVEETLKWGEASYQVKGGTPIRIDWKANEPEVIKVYFHCQTRMIETLKERYGSEFSFEGKRALVIPVDADINQLPLDHCLEVALKYHSLKHLPLLGAC